MLTLIYSLIIKYIIKESDYYVFAILTILFDVCLIGYTLQLTLS